MMKLLQSSVFCEASIAGMLETDLRQQDWFMHGFIKLHSMGLMGLLSTYMID